MFPVILDRLHNCHIFVLFSGGISFNFACTPLITEYTVEIAYPISEGLVGGFLTALNNFVAFLFLCVFFDKSLTRNVHWMNYLIVLAVLTGIPILLMTKESYGRLALDDGQGSVAGGQGRRNGEEEEDQEGLVEHDQVQEEVESQQQEQAEVV